MRSVSERNILTVNLNSSLVLVPFIEVIRYLVLFIKGFRKDEYVVCYVVAAKITNESIPVVGEGYLAAKHSAHAYH